jgi:hypothetical protein
MVAIDDVQRRRKSAHVGVYFPEGDIGPINCREISDGRRVPRFFEGTKIYMLLTRGDYHRARHRAHLTEMSRQCADATRVNIFVCMQHFFAGVYRSDN